MDWTDIARDWPALTGSLLARWPAAEENALLALDGDRAALVAYVARLESLPAEEAEERVADWAQTAMPADARMDPTLDGDAISAGAAELPPGEEPLHADELFGDEDAQGRTAPTPHVGRRGG